MGTLLKVKLKIKTDKDLRKMLVRGGREEILLDLDGDKEADVALIDADHDGDIDAIAVDLGGRGEFDLYLVDNDHNNIPDQIIFDEEGNGEFKTLAMGPEVEAHLIAAAERVNMLLMAEEVIAERVDEALGELEKRVRVARKELKKRT